MYSSIELTSIIVLKQGGRAVRFPALALYIKIVSLIIYHINEFLNDKIIASRVKYPYKQYRYINILRKEFTWKQLI